MLDNLHVEQIARGNRVAFKELHEELYGRMFYYVYKMLHDKEQSEDIIQEAFVLYWGNRVNFNRGCVPQAPESAITAPPSSIL